MSMDYADSPPPTYDSLFGKLKHAKQASNGNVDFLQTALGITTNTIGYTAFLVLMLAIPISSLVIGAFYIHQCPVQKYIPIYLIVMGVFTIVKNLSSIIQSFKARKEGVDAEEQQQKLNPFDSILSCFLFAWFICGNVWIYGIYNKFNETDTTAGDFCHPTLYYFSFWLLNVSYILIGVVFVCGCACCVYMCCIVKT